MSSTSTRRSGNTMSALKQKLQVFDMYGSSYDLTLNGRETQVRTVLGSLFSVIALGWLLVYAVAKFTTMLEYGDTQFMEYYEEYFYTPDDTMTRELGFNVAFAISNYDGSSEIVDNPDFVDVYAAYRIWGFNNTLLETKKEPTHLCGREELGLDYYNATEEERKRMKKPRFFRTHPESLDWTETYYPKMRCLDNDGIDVYGNYDSTKAKILEVEIMPCKGRSTCKSKEEIDEWINGKYLILIENIDSFYSDIYGNRRVQSFSRFKWVPLASAYRTDYVNSFTVQELNAQDLFV